MVATANKKKILANLLKDVPKKGASKGASKGTTNPLPVAVVKDPKKKRKPEGILRMYPPVKWIPMVWTQNIGIETTAYSASGSPFGGSYFFNLNSLYTNYVGATTFRAQGFNQLAQVYGRYKVNRVRVHIECMNPESVEMWIGFRLHQTGSIDFLSGETAGTSDMKKWTKVSSIPNSGDRKYIYDRYIDIGAVDGLSATQFKADIDNYSSVMAGSPSKMPFLEICSLQPSAGTRQVNCQISFTYYVQLYDRQVISSSSV